MTERASPAEYLRAFDTLDTLVGMVEAVSLNRARTQASTVAVPVVIVAGFLGAGKTTLLRHLLTAKHGLKIAAMVNDFAALNIDAALISEVSDDTTALSNGCVCCSLSGGVARGLAQIAARPEPADAILIECSGVSDPAGIAQVAASVQGVRLDSIVTVVDAATSQRPTAWDHLLTRQVAPATLVLVNKADLMSVESVEQVEKRLRGIAPRARMLGMVECTVPAAFILDAAMPPVVEGHAHPVRHDFATRVLTAPPRLTRIQVETALAHVPDDVLRIKGFLAVDGETRLLQCVGRRWAWHPVAEESPERALVVIGQHHAEVDAFCLAQLVPIGFTLR